MLLLGLLSACLRQQPPPQVPSDAGDDYLPVNADFGGSEYLTPLSTATTIRINAGGNAVTTGDGTVWSADTYFAGGRAYQNMNIDGIAATDDDILFKTERSATSDLGTYAYSIPLSQPGTYEVILHFAEIWFGAPGGASGGAGKRVFDVDIEGTRKIANFDIFSEVGATTAVSRTFVIEVSDGVLNLDFSASANRPKISAIEVVLTDASPPEPEPEPDPTDPDPGPAAVVRINVGGGTVTSGLTWVADSFFAGGRAYGNFSITDIANTDDDVLYLTERSPSFDGGTFSYAIPVEEPGTYQVRLHFAEIWFGATGGASGGVGKRLFSVDAEGTRILTDYDIYAEVGAMAAVIKSFAVTVNDGVLDLSFSASVNRPKISAIEVLLPGSGGGDSPAVTSSIPANGSADVFRDTPITTTLYLPNFGAGVDEFSLNPSSVRLERTNSGSSVSGIINTSGARDSIVFQPDDVLDAFTSYTFTVTEAVLDESGAAFAPYSATFTTGSSLGAIIDPSISFTRELVYDGSPLTKLTIGPDGKLYAAGLDGVLRRWQVDANGRLRGEQQFRGLEGRAVIGLTFDPNDDTTMYLWTSNNDPLYPMPVPDFSGKISKLRLRGINFFDADLQDYVVGLPRSARDHLTNAIAFGPDGMLYVSQGSNTGMGAPDPTWYNRPERLLTAAVLRVDTTITSNLPINVQTQNYEGTNGNYDPSAPGAPVTLFATGIRNAYSLVWHSNGFLYVPTNGGNAGGRTPASPNDAIPALTNVFTQPDFLYKVVDGGYYGHPNASRGEYVLNGGNPTGQLVNGDEVLPNSVGGVVYEGYPVGTAPDPNYRGFVERFCCNDSINGVLEYRSGAFDGRLRGNLLLVRFGAGKDVVSLRLDGSGNVTQRRQVMAGFSDPLDIVEDVRNGNLYVIELINRGASGRIQLLRPDDAVSNNFPPIVDAGDDQVITLPAAAQFAATASDEGLPNPPGALTYAWSKSVGPGSVTWSNPTSLTTSATFSTAGTYVLQITAFDGELSTSDQVTIAVQEAATTNQPPSVNAGPDQTITLPIQTVALSASASDDGLPNPPGAMTYGWSHVSGPIQATFSNSSSLQTNATLTQAGTYVMRFTASDGALSSSDDLTITVQPEPSAGGFDQIAWSSVSSAPLGRTEAQGGALDGKLYVFGGYTSWSPFCTTTKAHAYDVATNSWSTLPDMPQAWTHAMSVISGRTFYLAGGHLNDPNCNRTEFAASTILTFDVDTLAWGTSEPGLPQGRSSGGFVRLGSDLHFFGGFDMNGVDKGDHWSRPIDGSGPWQVRAPLPNPRSHLGAVALGGKIYAIGGQHFVETAAVTQRSLHIYDPISDTWTDGPDLPLPLSHHSASTFVVDDRILTVGGEKGHNDPEASVFAFDPGSGSWSMLNNLPVKRNSFVGGIVGGQLFITGGGGSFSKATYKGVPGYAP